MALDNPVYQPRDAINESIRAVLVVGGAGTLISAVQNTLTKQNVSAWGVFTRSGSTIVMFAAIGGSFQFTKIASANLRAKEDTWNTTFGGFMAGAVGGLRFRTLPAVLGAGSLFAIVLSTFEYTGGALTGYKKDSSLDEFDRKQQLRKDRRRPIQETIEQLGEGRGVYGPGYTERRRERIKENYGIDVPVKGV